MWNLPQLVQAVVDRSPLGTLNVPIPSIYFVRSAGPQSADERALETAGRFKTSIAAALTKLSADITAETAWPTVAGRGHMVIALPGHAETIDAADKWADLLAGTKIVGWGDGTMKPSITWSAAAGTVLFNAANCSLHNFNCYMAGSPTATTALTVAAPITVSAAGCGFEDCFFHVGVDADQIVTKAITGTDAADYLRIRNSNFYGATAAECTTVLEVLGSDFLDMENVRVQAGTSSATVGVMRLNATALLGGTIKGCTFINRKASSSHAVTGVASSAGVCEDTNFGVLDTSTLVGWQTKADWHFYRCRTTNTTGEAGGETSTVSA